MGMTTTCNTPGHLMSSTPWPAVGEVLLPSSFSHFQSWCSGPDTENPDNININDVLGDFSLTLIDSLDTLAGEACF